MRMLLPAIVPSLEVKRWTLKEYHQLIENGSLDEDDNVELLEGWIVPKMSRHAPHDDAIEDVDYSLRELLPKGWRVRVLCALAIEISESEPEPDLFVYSFGRHRRGEHPVPSETPFVIEVADSSLNRDRTLKSRIYARGEIPTYWIVNLPDRQVEVYTDPSGPIKTPKYRAKRYYRNGASVPVVIGGKEIGRIPVSTLLPEE